ncbi:MAG: hemerythrin domain-containing protein [Deltaproteobacteria bacterium]
MAGPIHEYLSADHTRLDQLLARAEAERASYEELRAGLLRHIAMEEKVLFSDARARRGGSPLPIVARLHADHAALASLLVPSPTPDLLRSVRDILAEHNPLEEREHGLYEDCEQLAGADVREVLARMQAIPPVRVSAHVDEARIHDHIARLLAARTSSR